jgi:hypothetical protein|tara:strand:- start:3160 stop:3711 length:552 start_codon:yes stop_codon:yes gene_type:complete
VSHAAHTAEPKRRVAGILQPTEQKRRELAGGGVLRLRVLSRRNAGWFLFPFPFPFPRSFCSRCDHPDGTANPSSDCTHPYVAKQRRVPSRRFFVRRRAFCDPRFPGFVNRNVRVVEGRVDHVNRGEGGFGLARFRFRTARASRKRDRRLGVGFVENSIGVRLSPQPVKATRVSSWQTLFLHVA